MEIFGLLIGLLVIGNSLKPSPDSVALAEESLILRFSLKQRDMSFRE